MLLQPLQTQSEYLLIDLQTQAAANHAQAGVVGSVLVQAVVEKTADGYGVRAPRRYRPLARKVFEKADHDHLQIDYRINPRATDTALLVCGSTNFSHFLRKLKLLQCLVKLGIKSGFRRL